MDNKPGCNLFVAGLPVGTDDERLRALFANCGNIVSAKVMVDLKSRAFRSHGFVMFDDPAAAAVAVSTMHRARVDDSSQPLHVAYATHSDTDRSVECEVIYVRNLPETVTVEQLRAAFTRFGSIVDVTLPSFGSSAHQGVGFVRFSAVDEARCAVKEAHNTMPFGGGHSIQVRFKESKSMGASRKEKRLSKTGPLSGSNSGYSTPGWHSGYTSPGDASLQLSPPATTTPQPLAASIPQPQQLSPTVPTIALPNAMMTAVPQPTAPVPQVQLVRVPFPGNGDLYFANYGAREDWLREMIKPWTPILLQPLGEGMVVRLADETRHIAVAKAMHNAMGPTGVPITAAILRV